MPISNKKRQPRIPSKAQSRNSWRGKVHPFFVRVAEYQKKTSLLTKSDSLADQEEARRMTLELPPELVAEAERLHDEMKAASTLPHRPSLAVYGAEGHPPGSVLPEEEYMYHRLCWFKYNKTVKQLQEEYSAGSFKAAKQLHKLNLEHDKWRFGKIDPNKTKFKTDVDHFGLMTLGLDLGILSLTSNELADCFDDLCPCGKYHDPESLKKLRKRIERAFPPTR